MAASTQTLRNWWSPACTGPFAIVNLHGLGRVAVRPSIVPAVRALNNVLVKYDYETRRNDTGAYNCRKITGGSGYSLHAYGTALDINWQSNPYGKRLVTDMPQAMINEIKAIRTNNGTQVWRWGGDYSGNKDTMHFEIVSSPNDIASGIRGSGGTTAKPVAPKPAVKIWKRGDVDKKHVGFIQFCLNEVMKYTKQKKLATDGVFGQKTEDAVVAFQRFANTMSKMAGGKGIAVDGKIGPQTAEALIFWMNAARKK